MKNRFIVVYSIFASLVFIFSISFFGFNLYNEYTSNYEKSNSRFKELTNNIRSLSFSYPDNNAAYSQSIKTAVGDISAYSYLQVRRNNETVVLYPAGKSREETSSRLTRNFDKNLTVNEKEISILCNIYLIRPDSIFYYARISFLLILIITLITIIMIIYLNLTDTTSDVISIEEESEDDEIDFNEEENDTEAGATEETEVEENVTEEVESNLSSENDNNIAETEAETKAEVKSETITTDESPSNNAEVKETSIQEAPAELPVQEVKPSEIPAASSDPAGLFDPDTGIGWESYLITRLNNEIDRATASEIDLSLFIFQLKNIEKKSEEFKNVCNYLGLQFQFKDLLFEYKDDCIVAIKISMNVDEAISFADKLYSDICNIINNKNCYIGISSRSIRMVTGERIMLEADQALEHAHEDSGTPIIAFRVDSEKYRQLMEQTRQ